VWDLSYSSKSRHEETLQLDKKSIIEQLSASLKDLVRKGFLKEGDLKGIRKALESSEGLLREAVHLYEAFG